MTERCWSETAARGWLEGNYNTRIGEIDLIMTVEDNVVFVKAPQRTSSRFRTPVETMNKQKR